jgi:hypothetical protein
VYDLGKLFREEPWWDKPWWVWVVGVVIVVGIEAVGVAISGDAGKSASQPTTANSVREPILADAPPATKSCGDIQLQLPEVTGSIPIKVEVVEGSIPCRAAQHVINDRYRDVPTGSWSCGGLSLGIAEGITTCEKNRGRHGTIRGRLYCGYWGPLQSRCLDKFGPP